ncbi:MAG: hypothetical protein Q9160_002593 [Pyrenula sp. 1 TL-2023]
MALPSPSFSFALPSVFDGTLLDCHLYHSKPTRSPENSNAAIVAHPYAPLGGSYDDPVVSDIANVLLREGYIVCLFNLRGAGKSGGRTSWSSKPELSDYVSFYGFMLHYVQGIGLYSKKNFIVEAEADAPRIGSEANTMPQQQTLILGGYSYGSLLVTHLPPVEQVIDIFRQPCNGSSEAVIRDRAVDLSKRWAKRLEEQKAHGRGRQRQSRSPNIATSASLSVAVGDESTGRRTSRDSRRSLDLEGIRKSFDQARARIHFGRMESCSDSEEEKLDEIQIATPSIQHLLVSPLLPPVSNFLTMFSRPFLESRTREHANHSHNPQLTLKPTLAIFGDSDTFTSKRKLRKWAETLTKAPGSRFDFEEIEGAGHFWRHTEEQQTMQMAIGRWLHSEKSTHYE